MRNKAPSPRDLRIMREYIKRGMSIIEIEVLTGFTQSTIRLYTKAERALMSN